MGVFQCSLYLVFGRRKTKKILVIVLYEAFYDFVGRKNVNIRDKIFQDAFCGAKTVSLQSKNGPYTMSADLCSLSMLG